MIYINVKGLANSYIMHINKNLSINNIKAAIQQGIEWEPIIIHEHRVLDGTMTITEARIQNNDVIDLRKEWEGVEISHDT